MEFYKNLSEFKSRNGYEVDGTWYPRVTSIVAIKAKPALYRFYADQPSYAAAEAMKEKSAQEGTMVHEVIEGLLGEKPISIPDNLVPLVTAFHAFQKQHEIIPHQIETQIVSRRHAYAGTIDVLAQVDGRLGVLDIKTSYVIYRDYGIQTAAYVEALHEQESMPQLTRWILRLDQSRKCLNGCGATLREKGGSDKVRNGASWSSRSCSHVWGDVEGDVELRELTDLEGDTRAFLAAKSLWEWEHDEWLRQVRPIEF